MALVPGQLGFVSKRVFFAGNACFLAATVFVQVALAGPNGGLISSGSGLIQQSGVTTTVNQSSQKLSINWQNFGIGVNEAVRFNQPNAASVVLNRVVGQEPSHILGSMSANGQVFVVNPNGVLFGASAQVNVGALLASTLDLSDANLLAGNYRFTGPSGAGSSVVNQGNLTAAPGGYVALLAPEVRNEGLISASQGTALLGAGERVTLRLGNGSLLGFSIDQGALNALVHNKQAIRAEGGQVFLAAAAADTLSSAVVNNTGVIEATGLTTRGGVIRLEADLISQTGVLDTSAKNGQDGGRIALQARAILDAGTARANGQNGGSIVYTAGDALIQTASANLQANGSAMGGSVHLEGDHSLFSSATVQANGAQGGTIDMLGQRVVLAAALVDASGTHQGGLIRIGGDFHGANVSLQNAKTTIFNGASRIKADGGGGQVVVWSDQTTDDYGSISANQGGTIEVSSKGTLTYAGRAETGVGGSLLLDPANIVIDNSLGPAAFTLIDPHPVAGNQFGAFITQLLGTSANGNLVVSVKNDPLGLINDVGAVYLFNTTTGALISTLHGSQSGDLVGSDGVIALSNGNFLVGSSRWNGSTGAVTWGSGISGVSGIVSNTNSLIGSATSEFVGATGNVTALTNGNYVVANSRWNSNLGAVAWGDGASGISGVMSASNSLVGTTALDRVGSFVTALSNGNYVVSSFNWNGRRGAATWGNGSGGTVGAVSSSNSLVGSVANSFVSSAGVLDLGNGNYVVNSNSWNGNRGAVTWGDGTGLTVGDVTSLNSLIGFATTDALGSSGIAVLSNHNYVVRSPSWSGNLGAATWGNGTGGTVGLVSSTNSLVGSITGDQVGSGGIGVLVNGNYVVSSPSWSGNLGAATWGDGTVGLVGTVTVSNSLVGTTVGDRVGSSGVGILNNGNYVVLSATWSGNRGAATWGDGTVGLVGAVSASNSLIGSTAGDFVGINVGGTGFTRLSNGNYVIASSRWNGNMGAVTWGNGSGGTVGAVSSSNSLVGSSAGDSVGNYGILALVNGNYVVRSAAWNGSKGAVTWGNGSGGTVGAVTASNSLVGSSSGDALGNEYAIALSNGNYVVASPSWNGGQGAITWGDGSIGIVGTVSSANSLIGSAAGDQLGNGRGLYALNDGNYVVTSRLWSSSQGAITWGNGLTGTYGFVTSSNSLLGSAAGDLLGNGTVVSLAGGNYVVSSSNVGGTGQVQVVVPGSISFATGSSIGTAQGVVSGATMGFNSSMLTATLAGGTAISLQASNDITLNADIDVSGSNGGTLSLQAGRNINLNALIRTANGHFSAIAGDPGANGADRLTGTPTITLGSGARIQAGNGTVTLAAIGGNFVNNSGSSTPIAAARTLIYSTDPAANSKGGMALANKHYNQSYSGAPPAYASTGDWFFYTIAPAISVAPGTQNLVYGTNPGSFTSNFSGFIDGDTSSTSGISGTASYAIGGAKSASNFYVAGEHEVTYNSGLLSSLGYRFVDRASSVNEYTVSKLALTGSIGTGKSAQGAPLAPGSTGFTNALSGDQLGAVGVSVNTAGQTGSVGKLNVGPYIGIQEVASLSGADAANYTFLGVRGDYMVLPSSAGLVEAPTNNFSFIDCQAQKVPSNMDTPDALAGLQELPVGSNSKSLVSERRAQIVRYGLFACTPTQEESLIVIRDGGIKVPVRIATESQSF